MLIDSEHRGGSAQSLKGATNTQTELEGLNKGQPRGETNMSVTLYSF